MQLVFFPFLYPGLGTVSKCANSPVKTPDNVPQCHQNGFLVGKGIAAILVVQLPVGGLQYPSCNHDSSFDTASCGVSGNPDLNSKGPCWGTYNTPHAP